MDSQSILSQRNFTRLPFPHFSTDCVLDDELADALLCWFKVCDHWHFTETSFYTQYEFSLLGLELPVSLAVLSCKFFTGQIAKILQETFAIGELDLVDITAHKLSDGFKMGVHNDFVGKEESHRLVIQLNDGWIEGNGGYLMLFNSKNPSDVANLILPVHNSGIGFEISPRSFHAVSTVYDFERYTLVYTFNDDSGQDGSK